MQDANFIYQAVQKIRLHKLLAEHIHQQNLEYTQGEIARNIEHFGVFLDQVLIKNRLQWVELKQNVNFEHWPKREKGNFEQMQILFENEDLLLINKPFGVVVESGAGHREDNLISFLQQKYGIEFFAAHRIDKDTQGLLLLAKNQSTLEFLQNQFRARQVKKSYLAVVTGLVDKIFWVENWQTRDKNDFLRQKLFWVEKEAKSYNAEARNAFSIIQPQFVCPDLNQSLIKVQIKTGRMHQIRLQCEALGFGLADDKIYNRQVPLNLQAPQGFLPLNPTKQLNKKEFLQLKQEIFGPQNYCLLSNFLELKIEKNTYLGAKLIEETVA